MRILVIGADNFVGRAIVRHLARAGHAVRALIPPGPQTPALPTGVSVEAVLTSLDDLRGLRAALVGIDAVISASGVLFPAPEADVLPLVRHVQTLAEAAEAAHTPYVLHLSTLGAEPASAYPWFKAHGLAELALQRRGLPTTVFRIGLPFGEGDDFTTTLALLLHTAPVFFLPGSGETLIHPLWVEDLAVAVALALEAVPPTGRTLLVGGAEHLTVREAAMDVARALGLKRHFLGLTPAYLRHIMLWVRYFFPRLPVSAFWLDYFAADRIAPADTLPAELGLLPERFVDHLEHLQGVPWRRRLLRLLFGR